MTHRSNVVQRREPLTEEQFRNTWLTTLGRLCRLHGDSQVAHWLGVSERHLRNIKSGASMPTADKIWNLLAYDESAHDELDGEFGHKNVPKDAVCTADPLTLDMIALAHETARDEADDSPGGSRHRWRTAPEGRGPSAQGSSRPDALAGPDRADQPAFLRVAGGR